MSPRAPTNHACVAGGLPPPNSAVPVLPMVPGGKPAPPAGPLVTTPSIIDRSDDAMPGSSGRGATRSLAAPTTKRGACQVPEATVAATDAMFNGDTTTFAWPIDVAACSERLVGCGTEPPKASRPRSRLSPMPNCAAVTGKLSAGRSPAAPMNAALHEIANACANVSDPAASPSKFRNCCPSTVIVAGHDSLLPG